MATGNKQTGGKADEREAARLIDALSARSRGEAPVDLEPGLEAELAGYLALTRRISALDDGPVAPSVRSAVMNEAARVSAQNAEAAGSAKQGWMALLLALLRPGPVLAMTALAAVAVAISLRSEEPVAERAGPEMVALQAPSRPVALADDPAGKAIPAPEPLPAAVPAPVGAAAEPAAALAEVAVGGGVAAAEPAPADQEEGLSAPLADARALPARPRTAIAASPASLGPVPEAPAAAALAQRGEKDDGPQSAPVQAAQVASAGAMAQEELASDSNNVKGQVNARYGAAKNMESQEFNEAQTAPAEVAAADTVAQRRESDADKGLAEGRKASSYVARTNMPGPSQVVAKAKPAPAAPVPAEAPRAGSNSADRPADTSEVERLRKALASTTSTSARVQVLEKLVVAEERAGDEAAAARTRKELAAARNELASESTRAKAAPRKVENSATQMK